MIYQIDVQITTPVYPTEVTERVETAVKNLFPGAEITTKHGELLATTHSLDRFLERVREQQIVPTAREVFYEHREGDSIAFDLKKQAALEEVVNFAVGAPDELGELHVRIRVTDPSVEEFIDEIFADPREDG